MKYRLAIVACLLIAVAGCKEVAIPPAGSYSEVLLVTERGEQSEWSKLVTPLIAREHDYITATEKTFDVTQARAFGLDDFPTYKNLVICGVLDTGTAVGKLIFELIGQAGYGSVMSGKATILKKEDLPAPGQLTLIITAPTAELLSKTIEERGNEFSDLIEKSCRARLRKHLMARPNSSVMAELNRKYGFTIEVPGLYHLLSDLSSPPGIELIRQPPTRVLGVFWVDRKEAPSLYQTDELFDLRAEYVWKRYDHDKMERDRVTYSWTRLGDHDAIRMSGYWYNDEAILGGYFETYFIYRAEDKLLWAVDLLTLAPGHKKHPLVRELTALAETFRFE